MRHISRFSLTSIVLLAGSAVAITSLHSQPTVAQTAVGGTDVGSMLRRSISTRTVVLKADGLRGEPREITASAQFDRPVEAAWIAVTGADIKFSGTTEKQINRLVYEVDPMPKIVNSRNVEVSGKFGLRDGSGNWDDTYEGTITVAVTAVLAD